MRRSQRHTYNQAIHLRPPKAAAHQLNGVMCGRRFARGIYARAGRVPKSSYGPTDLPVVAERVNYSPDPPAELLVLDRRDHGGTRLNRPFESVVRIFYSHHHPRRTPADGLGAEVEVLGRLVGHPELRTRHGQPGDDRTVAALDAEQLLSPERLPVEFDRPRTSADREHGGDADPRSVTHLRFPFLLIRLMPVPATPRRGASCSGARASAASSSTRGRTPPPAV